MTLNMTLKLSPLLLCITLALIGNTAEAKPVRGVVELFTSQGCSSCPPADRAFSTATSGNGILGLAWHVDYWNSLGWRDTFSSAQSTSRQRSYGGGVFTPQVIANGDTLVRPASSSGAIASSARGSFSVHVDIKRTGGGVVVEAGSGGGSASLVLVKFYNSKTVAITRGENTGKSVNYKHPVIGSRSIGKWNGKAISITLKPGECGGGIGCAVLLQRGTGPILGAAVL
jgi:hypothetical protein